MKPRPTLTEILQRAVTLHLRYYESLGQLAIDSLGALFGTVFGLRPESGAGIPKAADRTAIDPTAQKSLASTIVLEGKAGSRPLGVFLVENGLDREISTTVVASGFKDPEGNELAPAFQFEPDRIRLAPRQQILVRMNVAIAKSMRRDVPYRGEVVVPDLPGTRLPVVLRRSTGSAPGLKVAHSRKRKKGYAAGTS